jgi:hypothetical protein
MNSFFTLYVFAVGITNLVEDQKDDHAARLAKFAIAVSSIRLVKGTECY